MFVLMASSINFGLFGSVGFVGVLSAIIEASGIADQGQYMSVCLLYFGQNGSTFPQACSSGISIALASMSLMAIITGAHYFMSTQGTSPVRFALIGLLITSVAMTVITGVMAVIVNLGLVRTLANFNGIYYQQKSSSTMWAAVASSWIVFVSWLVWACQYYGVLKVTHPVSKA